MQPDRDEQGYVLLTTMWLLVLMGAMVAVLMLRSVTLNRDVKERGRDLEDQVVLESAVQTVLADRLFLGTNSQWRVTPTSGAVKIGSTTVEITLSNESGRLDINEANPELIENTLRGLGFDAPKRNAILGQINQRRASKIRIETQTELGAILGEPCLNDNFTLTSGLVAPRIDQMPQTLARALAQASKQVPVTPEPGAALRVQARLLRSRTLTVVARTTAFRAEPLIVSGWDDLPMCKSG